MELNIGQYRKFADLLALSIMYLHKLIEVRATEQALRPAKRQNA
jgi:hypothetical protein